MQKRIINLKEICRFLVGGGSAVIVDYIVYIILASKIDIVEAKAISFICGSIVGFIINKLWTFESKAFHKGEIVRYIILYICTAYINSKVNQFILLETEIKIVALLFATGTSTILNFVGQKFFVFRVKGE